MGINRLFPFLFLEQIYIEDLHPRSIAIDISCFIHKVKYANSCSLAIDETGKDFLELLEKYFLHFLSLFTCKIYFVFDGKVPDYKKNEHDSRRIDFEEKRKRALTLLKSNDVSEKYNGRFLFVQTIETRTLTELIKAYFSKYDNVIYVDAEYEADTCLARLSLFGSAEIIITEDSDLIVYGCNKIIFKLNHKGEGKLFNRDTCYISYESKGFYVKISIIDFDNLIEFCVMCGCDYFEGFKGVGPVSSLKICLSSRRLEKYLELVSKNYPEEFKKFQNSVNIFRNVGISLNN